MTFEWDEAKNRSNVQRHGIAFETAERIFEGPVVTTHDRRWNYGEDRYIGIGKVGGAVIAVVHTDRGGRTRLISARPASRKERQAYHEQIR